MMNEVGSAFDVYPERMSVLLTYTKCC
jgi:hypothetical protein